MCEGVLRVLPVVEQDVWRPHLVRCEAEVFHSGVLALVPLEIVVEPTLYNTHRYSLYLRGLQESSSEFRNNLKLLRVLCNSVHSVVWTLFPFFLYLSWRFITAAMSISWLVCQQDYTETTEWISTKLRRRMCLSQE